MEELHVPDYQAEVSVAFAREMWEKQSRLLLLRSLRR